MTKLLLEVKNLNKSFPLYGSFKFRGPKSFVRAARDVSFSLRKGEVYGLVGESGSGKTTAGRMILGLIPADSGQIIYEGQDLLKLSPKEFRNLRREIQLVFQDPFSSLNPRKRIGEILEAPLKVHNLGDKETRQERVFRMLETVGLQAEHYFRYPHEFSGGQRQRIGLARALIIEPRLLICDEPVSALDVSIQAQILNLLKKLQGEMDLTMMFITHDISVVRHISDRIGIMYLGKIVEEASTQDLFKKPLHPYTHLLFSAVPEFSKKRRRRAGLGETRPLSKDFEGCVFYNRCPWAQDICKKESPQLREFGQGHRAACHFVEEIKYDKGKL